MKARRLRVVWRVAGALALVALLGGCAQAANSATPRATAFSYPTIGPTITPLPPASLQWQRTSLSAGDAVAPSDASIAYTCKAPATTDETGPVEQPSVWATQNAGATWTRMADIPADALNNRCDLQVDQLNPSLVVAVLTWLPDGDGGGSDISLAANFVSYNSGGSWRKLTDSHAFMMATNSQTATRNGITYGVRGVLVGNVVFNGLWASNDHMATWRSIDPPGVGAADSETFAEELWVSPDTGEMLAAYGSVDAAQLPTTLWDSHDGGAHWTQLTPPGALTDAPTPFLIWSPGPTAPLTICDTSVGVTLGDQSGGSSTMCSHDDGKSWSAQPNITPLDASENTPNEPGAVFAIARDGSLLALLRGAQGNSLYRLTPGASQWQSLGDVPTNAFSVTYYATLEGGALWAQAPGSAPVIAALKTP